MIYRETLTDTKEMKIVLALALVALFGAGANAGESQAVFHIN